MSKILQQFLQSNTLVNQNNQQFIQSISNNLVSDSSVSIGVAPMDCSSQEIIDTGNTSTNSNENCMEDNQTGQNMSLPVESNSIISHCNQTMLESTTINGLNSNNESLSSSNELEQLASKQKQGKSRRAKRCLDSSTRRVEQESDLLPVVDQRNQRKVGRSSKNDTSESTLHSIGYQLSPQLTTANEILAHNYETISTGISLLRALKEELSEKTDRDTELKDCSGQTPVLIGNVISSLDNTSMEMAMISSSSHGCFYGVYQFFIEKDVYENPIYRQIEKHPNKPNIIDVPFEIINETTPQETNNVNVCELSSSQFQDLISNLSINGSCNKNNDSMLCVKLLNRFRIQIRLLTSEGVTNETSFKVNKKEKSQDFIEFPYFGQIQTNQQDNEPRNNVVGLPITRPSIIHENNN
ncbi:unnamed protein product [Rotaria sp. Silwood1]|nr:unnamed protein product [Rotaria sp. Silwood1]